jgi:hypothetical protein
MEAAGFDSNTYVSWGQGLYDFFFRFTLTYIIFTDVLNKMYTF